MVARPNELLTMINGDGRAKNYYGVGTYGKLISLYGILNFRYGTTVKRDGQHQRERMACAAFILNANNSYPIIYFVFIIIIICARRAFNRLFVYGRSPFTLFYRTQYQSLCKDGPR